MIDDSPLLRAAYQAFNDRDIDAALAVMAPDVDWPNGMVEGGRVHGHDAVRDYWTRQWSQIDPHVEPIGFRTGTDERITVDVHQIVRDLDGNLLVEQNVQHVYTLEDRQIKRMEIVGG